VLAYAALRDSSMAALILGIGAIGAIPLALVLVRGLDELLAWALIPLGVAYTVSLLLHGSSVDGGVPLVAAGLLLCAELAAWSVDEAQAIAAERQVVLARATALAALVLVGLAVSGVVVALSRAPADGLAWTAVGAAAAVGLVALAVRLAHRPSSHVS
jgi:hypothetical protein